MKLLIVIDMQNDFVTGCLGTPEARAIIPKVKKKIEEYQKNNGKIFVTQDTHYDNYLETNEGKHLPIKHCIANSDGWQIEDDVYETLRQGDAIYILKHTFGSIELINRLKEYIPSDVEEQKNYSIEIVGLALNICVITNAVLIKTYFPNSNISINLQCTAATNLLNYNATKEIMKSLQIEEAVW